MLGRHILLISINLLSAFHKHKQCETRTPEAKDTVIQYKHKPIIKLNIPILGQYIADIVSIVQWNL